ncbi:nitroreductase family protein [Marivirga atlantica]|jgi:nitroreductase|uniref:Nitroreductase family protein n=1 Tax=Marivirga atlantica TaxID=1548457 RepID=A0A937AI78_9BACT|nr:nitroreductase family protein [Marivirga atlantica]MBL0766658.1 nitroreductase family protein [Marivirga atlantica]
MKKEIDGYPYIQLKHHHLSDSEMIQKSEQYFEAMDKRRSVRDYSDKPVPKEVIENIIKTASTAPSGAHKQPWTFCVVSDPEMKKKIRVAAEKEEYESYNSRMSERWLKDLEPLGTDWHKEFLETVPYLIIVFKKVYEEEEGEKKNNYYVNESVGIACGFLISAIHQAGLATLTHTPSPMNFLTEILGRPKNERPFLLLPVGYPAQETFVPDIKRKELEEISKFY